MEELQNEQIQKIDISDEELKENEFDIKKLYKDNPGLNRPSITGRFAIKLKRQNTVHLRGVCPRCGTENVKFYKDVTLKGSNNTMHDIWFCRKCGKASSFKELKYVKYS